MIIGVPKEIKNNENRVGMTPAGVAELVKKSHTVYVQATAGVNSGFSDDDYIAVGAKTLPTIEDTYAAADKRGHRTADRESNLRRKSSYQYIQKLHARIGHVIFCQFIHYSFTGYKRRFPCKNSGYKSRRTFIVGFCQSRCKRNSNNPFNVWTDVINKK